MAVIIVFVVVALIIVDVPSIVAVVSMDVKVDDTCIVVVENIENVDV